MPRGNLSNDTATAVTFYGFSLDDDLRALGGTLVRVQDKDIALPEQFWDTFSAAAFWLPSRDERHQRALDHHWGDDPLRRADILARIFAAASGVLLDEVLHYMKQFAARGIPEDRPVMLLWDERRAESIAHALAVTGDYTRVLALVSLQSSPPAIHRALKTALNEIPEEARMGRSMGEDFDRRIREAVALAADKWKPSNYVQASEQVFSGDPSHADAIRKRQYKLDNLGNFRKQQRRRP